MKSIILFILSINIIFAQLSKNQISNFKEKLKLDKSNQIQRFKALKASNNEIITEQEQKTFAGFIGNMPVFYSNFIDGALIASNVQNAKSFNPGTGQLNLSGAGQTVYMWDLNIMGILNTPKGVQHLDFENRVTIAPNQTNSVDSHPTEVAGIMVGAGTVNNTKVGIAHKANIVSYDLSNDNSHFNEILNLGDLIKVSNHSYGIQMGWDRSSGIYRFYGDYSINPNQSNSFGSYDANSSNLDLIVYSFPNNLIVKAAGNNFGTTPGPADTKQRFDGQNWVNFQPNDIIPQKNCGNGYDCLTPDGSAKNILIVQSVNKITRNGTPTNYTQPSDVVHTVLANSGGVVGPRDDGAIKPDISAVGRNIVTTSYRNRSDYTNGTGWGTSYSAPVVSGIALLLNELWEAKGYGTMRSDVARGILTHTASEAGANPGPDPVFGWGLVNALDAVRLVANNNISASITTHTLETNKVFEHTVRYLGNEPLKVSMVWIDPPAEEDLPTWNNNRTSRLVNDLDIVVEKVSDRTLYYPWKLDADNPQNPATKAINNADTIEQVLIENPVQNAEYKIRINHKNNFLENDKQNFALIISGLNPNSIIGVEFPEDLESGPNPAKDFILINPIKDENIILTEIYDLNGTLIKINTHRDIVNQNNKKQIDVSKLLKGSYILKVITNKNIKSFRFLKE